jgi:hypothetical protein
VALVGLGSSSEHALELISEIVREASCPVIAILHAGSTPKRTSAPTRQGSACTDLDSGVATRPVARELRERCGCLEEQFAKR